jgi:tRNA pseudouridine38-40 synthase
MNFSADRFLRRMVRMLTGTLIEVGRGKLEPDEFCDILSTRDRERAGPCAPPHGLYLVRVEY